MSRKYIIFREGLETAGQRAYYFGVLGGEGEDGSSESKTFDKPMSEGKFNKLGSDHLKAANAKEAQAVKMYQSKSYGSLDRVMRNYTEKGAGESQSPYTDAADNLRSLVNKSELPESTSVFRSGNPMDFKDSKGGDLKVGSTVGGRGFISANPDVDKAGDKWTGKITKDSEFKAFQYNLPKGHPALALGHDQLDPYKKEVLMNPQQFEVTHIETKTLTPTDRPWDPSPIKYTVYHLSPKGKGK